MRSTGRSAAQIVNPNHGQVRNQRFHGEAFDFFRNDALNARDFFSDERKRRISRTNLAECSAAAIKNKLFFFGAYQQLMAHQGRTNVLTVPTDLQRQGIFTEGNQFPIYDPLSGLPFANNVIPANRIDPVSRNLASLFPLANRPGLANNCVDNTVNTENVPQGDIKVDWHITEKDHLFGRESIAHKDFTSPSGGNMYMMGGPSSIGDEPKCCYRLGWGDSSAMVNEVRVGFNRFNVSDYRNTFGIDVNNQLGLSERQYRRIALYLGNCPVQYRRLHVHGRSRVDQCKTHRQYLRLLGQSYVDTRQAHPEVWRKRTADSVHLDEFAGRPSWHLQFDGNYTSAAGAPGTGNPFASFLLGDPNYVARDFVNTVPAVRMTFAGFFVQDDYRITQSLTLNLGLRWDLFTRPVEKYNQQSNFDPTTGQIVVASSDNRGPNVDNHYGNWGPRAGLAYSPDHGKPRFELHSELVISPITWSNGRNIRTKLPVLHTRTIPVTHPVYTLLDTERQWTDRPDTCLLHTGGTLAPPPGFGVFYVANNFRQDEAQVWNFSVERQLPGNMMIAVAYVGTHGLHLYRDLQLNQSLPGPGDFTTQLPFYGVAPNIPTVDQRNGDGTSHYNALQVKLEKRYSSGLSFLASYTYSKTMDNTTTILYPWDDKLNYALSRDSSWSTSRRISFQLCL